MDKKNFLKKENPSHIKDMYVRKGCVSFWEDPELGDEGELIITLKWSDKVFYSDFWDVPSKCELNEWLITEEV